MAPPPQGRILSHKSVPSQSDITPKKKPFENQGLAKSTISRPRRGTGLIIGTLDKKS